MSDPRAFVKNATMVISRFGSWPEFHDAEIMRIELDRKGRTLALQLKTFRMLNEVDQQGLYKTTDHCLITFRFSGINKLTLADFNEQNVIFGLLFDQEDGNIKVTIEPSYGVRGIFLCREAEVIIVEPITEEISP